MLCFSKRLGDQLSAMSDRLQSDTLTAEKVPELKLSLATLQVKCTNCLSIRRHTQQTLQGRIKMLLFLTRADETEIRPAGI